MAFKLYALTLVACIAAVRSAVIQQGELPVPMPSEVTHQVYRIPQMPFQSLPTQGVTIQQDDVQLLAPEEKIIPLDKLNAIYKATGFLAHMKLKGLKLLKVGIQLLLKVAVLGVIAFSVAAVGTTITALFCKKTGLCTFTLHKFQFDRENIEAVRSLASDDHIKSLTRFVIDAIDDHTKNE